MSFTDRQLRKLRARLRRRHVKEREADGITLHYLEGWHVITEANRIFGFDGWDRETVASQCVWTKQLGSRTLASSSAPLGQGAAFRQRELSLEAFLLPRPAVQPLPQVAGARVLEPALWLASQLGRAEPLP